MDICPNCKSKLNIDEKASGRCFSCGATFESSLPKVDKQYDYRCYMNKCPNCGKILSEDEKYYINVFLVGQNLSHQCQIHYLTTQLQKQLKFVES